MTLAAPNLRPPPPLPSPLRISSSVHREARGRMVKPVSSRQSAGPPGVDARMSAREASSRRSYTPYSRESWIKLDYVRSYFLPLRNCSLRRVALAVDAPDAECYELTIAVYPEDGTTSIRWPSTSERTTWAKIATRCTPSVQVSSELSQSSAIVYASAKRAAITKNSLSSLGSSDYRDAWIEQPQSNQIKF